jgi:hypothetical protein
MNKSGLKKIYLFFSSIFIFLLHMPFVFAKTKPIYKIVGETQVPAITSMETPGTTSVVNPAMREGLYDSLKLGSLGLGRQVYDYALKGFNFMKEMGTLANDQVISIVDFSKPSYHKRLFVLDLKNCKLLFNTYVAHGRNSGEAFANRFSNKPESFQSSLGFYETLGTYNGGNGYSLRLQGMERGINDNANKRDIVIHGADYVNEKLIRTRGYIGRSFGCPAIPQKLHRPIIDKIKNGTCLFIFSPDKKYLDNSGILNRVYSPSLAVR